MLKVIFILVCLIKFVQRSDVRLMGVDTALKRFNLYNGYLRQYVLNYFSDKTLCKLSTEDKRDTCFTLIRLKHGELAQPYMPYNDLGIVLFKCQKYKVQKAKNSVKINMFLCPGYKISVEKCVRVTKPFFVSKGDTGGSVFIYESASKGDVQILGLAESIILG